MIMTRKQFAYHEATFYLVRLLQQFTEFTLDDANNVKPPADWAGCDGLKGKDKIVPGAHLTLYVKVSQTRLSFAWGERIPNVVSCRAGFG